MKINDIVLIRPSQEENCNCTGRGRDQQKNLGRMKPISAPRRGVRFLPDAGQQKQTRKSDDKEAPHHRLSWPSGDKNELIGHGPKRSEGQRYEKNVPSSGIGGRL